MMRAGTFNFKAYSNSSKTRERTIEDINAQELKSYRIM